MMNIRHATLSDLPAIAAVEAACFSPAEAATEQSFAARLRVFPDHFWLLEDEGKLVGFIDGMVSDEPAIRDEMFADAGLHNPAGAWQAIFGVLVLPEYRRQGCAARLMRQVIADARAQGRRGCTLTCKAEMVRYYEQFGYQNQGLSGSAHAGVTWYDMRLMF
jgi:ribosomal protein S18 acetylase RimI-like enzyme